MYDMQTLVEAEPLIDVEGTALGLSDLAPALRIDYTYDLEKIPLKDCIPVANTKVNGLFVRFERYPVDRQGREYESQFLVLRDGSLDVLGDEAGMVNHINITGHALSWRLGLVPASLRSNGSSLLAI